MLTTPMQKLGDQIGQDGNHKLTDKQREQIINELKSARDAIQGLIHSEFDNPVDIADTVYTIGDRIYDIAYVFGQLGLNVDIAGDSNE